MSAKGAMKLSDAAAAAAEPIVVRGARVHNLRDVDVEIPSGRLVVFTGVSGSGKSSLAFDTLYAEGQRRYVESLSAYARQFLERMDKPDVDDVRGVSPAIAIQQKAPPKSSRSTVGTATEIQDYLRLLFARAGVTYCPSCDEPVRADTPGSAVDSLLETAEGRRVVIMFPVTMPEAVDDRTEVLRGLLKTGFRRGWAEGEIVEWSPRGLGDLAAASPPGRLPVVVDRLRAQPGERERLVDSMEIAFRQGEGRASVRVEGVVAENAAETASSPGAWSEMRFDDRFRCSRCDLELLAPEPRLFSFNNPYGACQECKGFGNIIELDLTKVIPDPGKTLEEGAIEPWEKPSRGRWRTALRKFCAAHEIPMDVPWLDLSAAWRNAVLEGEKGFSGVRGFFDRLRKKKHKLHLRVLLARYRGYVQCPECGGTRLRTDARAVRVGGLSLPAVVAMTIGEAATFFGELELSDHALRVVGRVLEEIRSRLRYLVDVGLDYLTLDRLTGTLSGGEAQRINLATCLGSTLVGAMYVLDEPSVGLHARDNDRLTAILKRLRDVGNSVLVVEHDRSMIEASDHVIDLGPGAGTQGGRVVAQGTPSAILESTSSITAAYLRGDRRVPLPVQRRPPRGGVTVVGAREHNLAGIDVTVPLGVLCCVTGVSGSGKSTLVHDVLYSGLKQRLGEAKGRPGDHDFIRGAGKVRKVVLVDQSPIGRSSRSNPVIYIKAFDAVREVFARTREAKARGYAPGHFSFNVPGGRCDACAGAGEIVVEMQFLSDVSLPCEECGGRRFRREVLEIDVRGKNIDQVLQMTVNEARRFFVDLPKVSNRLKVLEDVGLGYLRLGQASTTLSGGEAQRVKLAAHLLHGGGRGTLYLFDEPTTGLHFDDIAKLLYAINRLIDAGASVIVIEHNLDLIKAADFVVDLGPEGGAAGGRVVAQGTPEEIAATDTHTGRYLVEALRDS